MKAKIKIEKSFEEDVAKFSKNYSVGDFEEFFADEGVYLDRLADMLRLHGDNGDSFTIVYEVKLTK